MWVLKLNVKAAQSHGSKWQQVRGPFGSLVTILISIMKNLIFIPVSILFNKIGNILDNTVTVTILGWGQYWVSDIIVLVTILG